MTIHQLSVFLENKPGTLDEILNILKSANVQIIASTISDTVEYGIYRVITNEPYKALEALKTKNITANLSDVFAISLDNKVGKASDVISLFTKAGVNFEYLYSYKHSSKELEPKYLLASIWESFIFNVYSSNCTLC